MRDLLPEELINLLHDRYIAGVATAEAHFGESSADEDALTGALGQAIAMRDPITFADASGTYSVSVSYRKLRGRGLNAPERLYGSDGLFQIAITTGAGTVLRMKALPFQAKTNWRGRNRSLANQALDMQRTTGSGLVIDYGPNGYRACETEVVIAAHGNRAEVNRRGAMSPLGQVLGVDFLECKIGTVGLYYDVNREHYVQGRDIVSPAHAITTRVTRASRAT